MTARLSDNITSIGMREYSEEELRLATDNFSERLRLKSGRDWTNVYRGRFNHSTVAIKMLPSFHSLSQEEFQTKVIKLLSVIFLLFESFVFWCIVSKSFFYPF